MLIFHSITLQRDEEKEEVEKEEERTGPFSDLLETNYNATATLAICSLSALEWIIKPKSSFSSASKNGRRILALLSMVIGSKAKASEIVGRIYFPSSSIMTTDGGKHVSVIHCPATSSSTSIKSRQIEYLYTKGGSEQEELSICTETLRRSPLQKKKKMKEDRRYRAFFLATYDSSMRTIGDLVQKKKHPLEQNMMYCISLRRIGSQRVIVVCIWLKY
uniref:Wsv322-like protein n=1 Tax=Sesarmops intermedium nimavirus TaxID=2133796 RepID=A0A401IPQ0_9VIRU|nr:MAG: wsv322-like protein [Sesarmops intermedium nimavirus]GBG35589.1 wsv322-like protein [Sesarmops intermedium nimavirus]